MSEAASESHFRITTDTPYLALTGELYGVFCEDFGENWLPYNGTTLYLACTDINIFIKQVSFLPFNFIHHSDGSSCFHIPLQRFKSIFCKILFGYHLNLYTNHCVLFIHYYIFVVVSYESLFLMVIWIGSDQYQKSYGIIWYLLVKRLYIIIKSASFDRNHG